jgi:hypothetical protein
MDFITPFHTIWDNVQVFTVDKDNPAAEKTYICGYAQEFASWVDQWICSNQELNLIQLNQLKVILLDKYLEWRSFVPKIHQEHVGGRGHHCIYHIFIRACEHLKVEELRMQKPMLFIPPPPQPRFDHQGPMLFLGEIDE